MIGHSAGRIVRIQTRIQKPSPHPTPRATTRGVFVRLGMMMTTEDERAEDRPPSWRTRFVPRTAEGWLVLTVGLAMFGYGWYLIVRNLLTVGHGSLFGLVLTLLGVTLMPSRLVGLVCGIGLLGVGAWMLVNNHSPVQSIGVVILGLFAVAERIRQKAS